MKRMEEIKKKVQREWLEWKRNPVFFIMRIIIFGGAAAAIILPCMSETLRYCDRMLVIFCSEAIGTAAQIVTATVGVIVSVIGISISLQSEEFFGITVTELYNLRKRRHYSIPCIIELSFCFCIAIGGSYLLDKYVSAIGLMIAVVIFVIVVMINELPLMIKKEIAAYEVLKDNLFAEYSYGKPLDKNVRISMRYLLSNKTFKEVYLALKSKSDKAYNHYVFEELLETQAYFAHEVKVDSIKEQPEKVYDNLLHNIYSIIVNDMDLSEQQYAEIVRKKYHLTRALFGIWRSKEGKKLLLEWLPSIYEFSFWLKGEKEEVGKLCSSIIVTLIANTVKEGDLDIIRSFRKYLSSSIFGLNEPSQGVNAFAVISAHLYYLYCLEPDVSDEVKDKIKEFLDAGNCIEDQTRVRTWRNLFYEFSYDFKVEFQEFLSLATENRHNLEVYLFGTGAKRVIWGKELLTIWFLTHFLNRKTYDVFKYNQFEIDDLEVRQILKRVGSECINLDNDIKESFIPTDEMCEIVQFYNAKDEELFSCFNMDPENIEGLSQYINQLKLEELEERRAEVEVQDLMSLGNSIKTEIETQIHQEWGYNESLVIQKEQRGICFEFERFVDSKNTKRFVSHACIDAIFNDIKNQDLRVKIINKNENNDPLIEEILTKNIKYATWSAKESIHRFHIKNAELKDCYKNFCKELELIHSRLLGFTTLVEEDGFSFNCVIDEFELRQFTEDECLERVKKYQREDGQYVYKGAFMSKANIIKHMKSTYAVVTIILRHDAHSSPDKIFTFE